MVIAGALYLQQSLNLRVGTVITRSCSVNPGRYALPSGQGAAVTVRGNGITVDFGGATLVGTPETVDPDKRTGTGIVIEGKNVTVKNLKARGYMVAVRATGVDGLKLVDCDVSYNWKQRLGSKQDREDSADWMSYHQNEKDEWLRYGAGIYLRDCDNFEVKGCTARGGQNGLMMTGCDDGLVWNNDLSFLSSIGIGMYRCGYNRVMHNNIDWCVRGYSHGVYNRGQDSAGILVYEQSNGNTFAYNSVTHGGDGFFLWAGQTTMDTGEGGCNDNLVYGNDFSHAPTNGIEATFSRNVFAGNLLMECWHGVWGGYSYDTKIVGNVFALNGAAIAIEHGQDNEITGNVFRHDHHVFQLWANESQDPNWGYPKSRDTRSRDYKIDRNVVFDASGGVFNLSRTKRVTAQDNFFRRFQSLFSFGSDLEGLNFSRTEVWSDKDPEMGRASSIIKVDGVMVHTSPQDAPPKVWMQSNGLVTRGADQQAAYLALFREPWPGMRRPSATSKSPAQSSPEEIQESSASDYWVKPLTGGKDPFKNVPADRRGRKTILVDEWGPYDYLSPKLWPEFRVGGDSRHFRILGPAGEWKVKSLSKGVKLSDTSGKVPGEVTAIFTPGAVQDIEISFQYRGAKTVDYRGVVTAAGKPVTFGYSHFFVPVNWTVSHWNYNKDKEDPRTQADAFAKVLAGPPAYTFEVSSLNGDWGGSPKPTVNPDYFATKAVGDFTILPGEYEIVVTSDDGVRVRLDGKVILDDWTYHGPKTDTIPLRLGGTHNLEVDHFELNGYSTLKLEIRKKR